MLLTRIARITHASSTRSLSTQATRILTRLDLPTDPSKPIAGVYNGTWQQGAGETLSSYNPTNGELLATVSSASSAQTEETLAAARDAYRHWRNVSAPARGEVLRQLRLALEAKSEALGELVSLEMGKVRSEGLGEVREITDVFDYAVGLSRSIGGTVVPSERSRHFITEVSNPLGVVGVITAFNFPTAVYGWNLALSLVTGNATIWKPSPTTPLCAIALTKIISSTLEANGVPGALSSLLSGGGDVGSALVNDKRVDLLSFTGSEARGREVGMAVAGRFGQSILELGGNNAAVVLPDANLQLALRSIVFAALGTAGQRCTTTRRLFLHRSIASSFLSSLTAAFASASSRMGDPLATETLVGPLHSKVGVEAFEKTLKEINDIGGEVLCGGSQAKMSSEFAGGNWVAPTIVRVPKGSAVMQRETFAPVLYVQEFDTLEEAIELNNSVEQGLSSALFTKDLASAFEWIGPNGSDCGLVNVNGSTSGAEVGARFGGNKSTGWGRESGGDAWKQYCRWSSCTLNFSDEVGMAQGVTFE